MKKDEVSPVEASIEMTESLADAIVRLSAASERLLASGLTVRAIAVLIKSSTNIDMATTTRVLQALPTLAGTYTTKGTARKRK